MASDVEYSPIVVGTPSLDNINHLQRRIDNLEGKICDRIEDAQKQTSILDQLIRTNDQLINFTAGRDKFNLLSNRIQIIEGLLNKPQSLDGKKNLDAKKQLVLLEEPKLRRDVLLFQEVIRLQKVMDSPALKNYEHLGPKMDEIRKRTLKQLEEARKVNEETQNLIRVYAKTMTTMKGLLADYDQKIKKRELEAKNQKKN